MIQVHSWPTPNGQKVHIMLEELGLEYTACPIDIGAGDQFKPTFLEISPNNKIPAIVDEDGPGGKSFALAESGAILVYLAEKSGQFYPSTPRERYTVLQWLMFQMGHVGPMLGQAHHFRQYAPIRLSYGIERYSNESNRLHGVLDDQLADRAFIAADQYTIADIATFPWVYASPRNHGIDLDDYPHVRRWANAIAERPAVQRGLAVLKKQSAESKGGDFDTLFGNRQFRRHRKR